MTNTSSCSTSWTSHRATGIARHAFESVAIDLVTRFPEYKKVLGRHGIKIGRDLLIDQLQSIIEGSEPRFIEGADGNKEAGAPASKTRSR